MLLALFVLTLTTLILGAVYQAVTNDTQGTRLDLDQSRAYAAAQAGIAAVHLPAQPEPELLAGLPDERDSWEPGEGRGAELDGRRLDRVLHATSRSPRRDQTACSTSNPAGTMLEGATSAAPGTFRIESTGYSCALSGRRLLEPDLAIDRRRVQTAELPQLRLLHRLRDARPGHALRPEQHPA